MSFKFDSDRNLGLLIHDVARLLRRNFDRRLQSLGLTQAQWRAIAHLSRNEGMSQATLADVLEVQAITLARLVDRLEAAGWVERRSHPSDRRAVQLYLTAKCQPILAEMHRRATDTFAETLVGISASAQEEVIATLQRMKQNLVAAENAATESQTKRENHEHVGRKPTRVQRTR